MFIPLLEIPFVPGLKVKLKFHLGTHCVYKGVQPSSERILWFASASATPGSCTCKEGRRASGRQTKAETGQRPHLAGPGGGLLPASPSVRACPARPRHGHAEMILKRPRQTQERKYFFSNNDSLHLFEFHFHLSSCSLVLISEGRAFKTILHSEPFPRAPSHASVTC